MAIQTWNIRSRANQCAHSEAPFEDKSPIFTAIFFEAAGEGEDDKLCRRDYSESSWEELQGKITPFSFWRSIFEVPIEEDSDDLGKEDAEHLLARLIEADDPNTENARYILALMLERDKTIRPTDTQETNGTKILFYEHCLTGEVLIIRDPNLHLNDIVDVQEQVSALLESPPKTGEGEGEGEGEKTEPENATPASEEE